MAAGRVECDGSPEGPRARYDRLNEIIDPREAQAASVIRFRVLHHDAMR